MNHICNCVRQRTKRTRRSNVPESLLKDRYDEIGTISYQAVNISPLATDQTERIQQFRRIRSPQPESATANVNNQLSLDRTFNTTSRLSVQENQPYALHPNNIFGATSNVSLVLATEDIVHINGSYDIDPSGESSKSFQSERHQYEHSSNSNSRTTISPSSDKSRIESSGTTLVGLDIDEGYENPYQIVIREEKDSHKYSYLTKQSEQVDNDSSLSDTAKLSRNNCDYVNLRL